MYQELFDKRWPQDWHVQTVMGLTDPKGKTIYLADGLSPQDNFETLLHEFIHMEGEHEHGQDFEQRLNSLITKAARKRIFWEGLQD